MPVRKKNVAAVIMASGFSRRMGQNKLALDLEGKTVIERVMDLVAGIGYSTTIVVSQYDQFLIWADERGLYPLINPYAAEGKSSSVRLGASILETLGAKGKIEPPAGIIFIPGDQILLTAGLLRQLNEAFLARPDRIVFPVYDGEPGSPAIFPADLIPRLKKLEGEEGGKSAAKEYPDRIVYVRAEPGWQGMDFDTAEDWENVKKLFSIEMQARKA